MIRWNDFIIDDFLGPLLTSSDQVRSESLSGNTQDENSAERILQETRRDQWPARMAGYPSLEKRDGQEGMDAARISRTAPGFEERGPGNE